MIISTILFSGISFALFVFRISIPYVPSFLATDFSVLFELLAAIAYGPIIGAVVCLLKTVLCVIFVNASAISAFLNFLVETTFVAIAGYYYSRSAAIVNIEKHPKMQRRQRIFMGALIGVIPALAVQFVLTNNYVFRMFEKYYASYGYTKEMFVKSYAQSARIIVAHLPESLGALVPEIDELWKGILMFNTPITLAKYIVVTLVVMLIYPFISHILHFTKKEK